MAGARLTFKSTEEATWVSLMAEAGFSDKDGFFLRMKLDDKFTWSLEETVSLITCISTMSLDTRTLLQLDAFPVNGTAVVSERRKVRAPSRIILS